MCSEADFVSFFYIFVRERAESLVDFCDVAIAIDVFFSFDYKVVDFFDAINVFEVTYFWMVLANVIGS